MLQRVNAGGAEALRRQGRASYRADITATLPAPAPSGARATLAGHLRFGRGPGLETRPTYTGSVNSLAFETADGASRFAVLAQLFYQLDMPLRTHDGSASWGAVNITAGKMDPFTFFDQNSVADDESSGFINNVFVHNPLLDSGGDIGADRYGFTPGIRAAWSGGSRRTRQDRLLSEGLPAAVQVPAWCRKPRSMYRSSLQFLYP